MKVKVLVTDIVKGTKTGNGTMQHCGIMDGSNPFPVPTDLWIPPDRKPLAKGEYIAEGSLRSKGYDLVFDMSLDDLSPAKNG